MLGCPARHRQQRNLRPSLMFHLSFLLLFFNHFFNWYLITSRRNSCSLENISNLGMPTTSKKWELQIIEYKWQSPSCYSITEALKFNIMFALKKLHFKILSSVIKPHVVRQNSVWWKLDTMLPWHTGKLRKLKSLLLLMLVSSQVGLFLILGPMTFKLLPNSSSNTVTESTLNLTFHLSRRIMSHRYKAPW